jgi:hypothetical protein
MKQISYRKKHRYFEMAPKKGKECSFDPRHKKNLKCTTGMKEAGCTFSN